MCYTVWSLVHVFHRYMSFPTTIDTHSTGRFSRYRLQVPQSRLCICEPAPGQVPSGWQGQNGHHFSPSTCDLCLFLCASCLPTSDIPARIESHLAEVWHHSTLRCPPPTPDASPLRRRTCCVGLQRRRVTQRRAVLNGVGRGCQLFAGVDEVSF